MNARRVGALLALPAAVLTACTSSGKGSPNSSAAVPSGVPTDPPALSALVRSAVAGITSAHLDLTISLAGEQFTGGGDEKLANGKLVGLDVTENVPGAGAVRIISIGGTSYAKLPTSMNLNASKPWLVISPDSGNSVIRQLAASLDSALSSASLGNVSVFVGAAKSLTVKGSEPVGGRTATHYSIDVEIAKLPADLPGRSELASSGVETIPLELYIDAQGRPVKISEDLPVQGQTVSSTATISDYNKPVSISAPPANQIGG
jgi:hypothetical protein